MTPACPEGTPLAGLTCSVWMVDKAKSCPPQIRAASTRPTAPKGGGFVEVSPSRVLRDGEGTFRFLFQDVLPQPARRIGRGRNLRRRRERTRVCGDLGWRRLRQANSDVHFEVLLGAARTKGFSCIFVAQAGQFVAAVDAVAISRRRSRLDRHQSHCVYPFLQDTTSARQFAQEPGQNSERARCSSNGF
jgi:hypothetical protein